jgi:CxxC-x17-CxxC domain-containing protein
VAIQERSRDPVSDRTSLAREKIPEVRSFVYEDKTITCADCGQPFTFTASEQAFYAEKGFSDSPKRCKTCRQARKQQRNSPSYGGDDSYGGGSSYGGGGSSYDRAPRQMYDAVCADCGKTAQVPFQPTGSRPVYCNDCFRARR